MLYFDQIANGDTSFAILEAAEIDIDRAILAYETAKKDEELRLRSLECKCVLECGDGALLMDIFEDGESNAKDNKGLLKTIWEKIVNALKTLKNKLFGKKIETSELPQKMKVPKPISVFIKGISGAWSAAKSGFADIKVSIKDHKGITALIAFITTAIGIGAGIKIAHDNAKADAQEAVNLGEAVVNSQDVVNAVNTCEDITNTVTEFTEKCANNPDKSNDENTGIINTLKSGVAKITSKLQELLNAAKQKVTKKSTNNNSDDSSDGDKEGTDNKEGSNNGTNDSKGDNNDNSNGNNGGNNNGSNNKEGSNNGTNDSNGNNEGNNNGSNNKDKTINLNGDHSLGKVRNELRTLIKNSGKSGNAANKEIKELNSMTDEKKILDFAKSKASKYGYTINEDANGDYYLAIDGVPFEESVYNDDLFDFGFDIFE